MPVADELTQDDACLTFAALCFDISDTPREADFDELARLAANICDAPLAVVTLIEACRHWFEGGGGVGVRGRQIDPFTYRHGLSKPEVIIVADPGHDLRVPEHPLVSAMEGFRFCAGCVLETAEGLDVGTLCIFDSTLRELDEDQRLALRTLAGQIMTQLELRRSLRHKVLLLDQKGMQLKEVNHRTKNNLQLIVNLIQLQRRDITDELARAALLDTSRRIMSIAAVHEKLYSVDQIEVLNGAAYLREVIEGVKATAPANIFFDVSLASLPLPLDIAIPLALMVNELATNALKYAYPNEGPGSIHINLAEEGERVTLTVADDGRGLPEEFDQIKHHSLGMRIITALASQLGAAVIYTNRQPGAGCRVTFTPPR